MSVAQAQLVISSREFAEWRAFYQIEPFGEKRSDMQAAHIASAIFDVMAPKKNGRWKWWEVMPIWEDPTPRVQTMDEQLALVKELHAAFGGE